MTMQRVKAEHKALTKAKKAEMKAKKAKKKTEKAEMKAKKALKKAKRAEELALEVLLAAPDELKAEDHTAEESEE